VIASLLFALSLQIHPIRAAHGMVVSDSVIASEVGRDVMKRGGNAVDAAVATALALAVTHPAAGNLGGGGFMLVRMADGRAVAIDYRETAPAGASRNMYLGPDGKPTKDSLIGFKASGVPGTVAGMVEAHRRFGKLPWKDLVEPAYDLANKGFAVPYGLADSLKSAADSFKPFPASYRQFCRDGQFLSPMETFRQSDLAHTLSLIRDQGADGFYRGETAVKIAKAMKAGNGLITENDLRNYQPKVREVLRGSYKGYEILTMPPPSSGGIAMLQMLGMMEKDDVKALGYNSSGYLHHLVESMKRAFADRAVHLGDPDFVKVPVGDLLDPAYIASRRAEIGERATPSTSIKALGGTQAGVPEERWETTHFSVVDGEGNAVSNTYTLNGGYGCFAVADGTGVLMNNEMDDFAAAPGVPNGYGLIQGENNAIAPGKRPLSSMTPTIVLRDGKLVMVLGSPGGPTIINTVMQTVLNVVDFDMTVQRAVAAPRFHHQWMPDEIQWEPFGLSKDVRSALEAKGHVFKEKAATMGSCHAIKIDPKTGERQGGIDPRISTAGAAGY
jgi:gamma-glutamyltranspeptidase/glutathione hydrolase